MKFRTMWLPLVAALALPGALRAQEDDCPCRRGQPGMIGVQFEPDGPRGQGVRVIEVRPGSPAERAGVRAGDVVVRVNGGEAAEIIPALPLRLLSGDTVHLRVQRDGGEREVVVVAAPRPEMRFNLAVPRGEMAGMGERIVIINGDTVDLPPEALAFRIDSLRTQLGQMEGMQILVDSLVTVFSGEDSLFIHRLPGMEPMRIREGVVVEGGMPMPMGEGRPFFMELGRRAAAGAELAEMNEGLSTYFGGQREGALVIDVAPETPAARAGLRPGDVIVRAGGDEVSNPEDVRRALNGAEEGQVALEVIRQGRRQTLSLEWSGGDRVFHREIRGRAVAPRRAPRN